MFKTVITAAVLALTATASQADCVTKLTSWANSDPMIKSFEVSETQTTIWINNIRNMNAINIENYGFDAYQAEQLETEDGCVSVVFEEAYDKYGIPRV